MIIKREDETIDSMLFRFKKETNKGYKLQDYRKHLQHFTKGEKRRLKSLKGMRKF